ncbi:hypothetical protein BGW39_001255 [Mortierella sp. 14UC]|nr:hypothetical protein BGW39_001255 [Mortierella sp. 14UC]
MEYVNPTTISFVAAGAGAGAYYVYANVIEPQNQAQRVLQAEEAQKELLLNLEEEEASRRGSNKQAKKKPIVVCPKKVEHDNSDVTPEELNKKISTSNPFDLLETKNAAANATAATNKAKKSASKKKVEVTAATTAPAPVVETKTENVVKFDPTPEIKELPKVVSKKGRKAAANKEATTGFASAATIQSTVVATAAAASKKADQQPEAGSPREPENLQAPKPFKPVRGHRNTFAAPTPIAPTVPEAFQPVKSPRSLQGRKQHVVSSPVVSAVTEEEYLLAVQELKALKALVQARDLALAAAESRAERSLRKIQELQKQIESEATLVKSAQKTENRAQKLNERVESLHYTNSILVRQLSVEKENLKTAQLQAIKKEAELAATAAAAAAASAENRVQRAVQAEHLQELNRGLQQHRTQSETDISQLSRSLVDADQRADNALRERNEIHHKLSTIISDKEARIVSLEADIGALEGELENSKDQVEQYAEAVSQAEEVSQSRHEILEGEKHSLLEEIDLLRDQLVKEESKVSERDGEAKKLQKELESVREQVRKLEADHASTLSTKHAEHQHVLSTKESTVFVHMTNLTAALAEVETVRVQLKEACESHQGELEKLVQELEKSNTQIVTLNELQRECTTKMTELTERSNDNKRQALEQSAALNKRIQELEQEIANKESSHQVVSTEKEDLAVKLLALEAEHESCHKQHGALTKEKQDLRQTVSTKTSELEQLRQEKDELATELAQKKAGFVELETAKQASDDELMALINASEFKKTDIEEEYDALSLKVVDPERELGALQQQQKQAEGEQGKVVRGHIDHLDKVMEVEETVKVQVQGGDEGTEIKTSDQQQQQGHKLFNVQEEGLAVATY